MDNRFSAQWMALAHILKGLTMIAFCVKTIPMLSDHKIHMVRFTVH